MNPRFLELLEVLELHESRISLYGGATGLRDIGLLQSALAQPKATYEGEFLHKDIFEMAAAYLFHISRTQAFVDGNKRTALACCLIFLDYNGYELDAPKQELEDIALATAVGSVEKSDVACFLRKYCVEILDN